MSECLFMFTQAWLLSRYPEWLSFPFYSMEKDLAIEIYYVKGGLQQKLQPLSRSAQVDVYNRNITRMTGA